MKIEIIKCLEDNFSYLLINEKNSDACVVDPGESKPVLKFIEDNKINLKLEGDIGISVSAFDMLDGYLHKVGISRFQLFLDNKLIIDNKIDTLSYSETNFVSWFIDQDIFKKFRKQYVKLYQDDGNKLSFHKNSDNGIINFTKEKSYNINIVVFDYYKNQSNVENVQNAKKIHRRFE